MNKTSAPVRRLRGAAIIIPLSIFCLWATIGPQEELFTAIFDAIDKSTSLAIGDLVTMPGKAYDGLMLCVEAAHKPTIVRPVFDVFGTLLFAFLALLTVAGGALILLSWLTPIISAVVVMALIISSFFRQKLTTSQQLMSSAVMFTWTLSISVYIVTYLYANTLDFAAFWLGAFSALFHFFAFRNWLQSDEAEQEQEPEKEK